MVEDAPGVVYIHSHLLTGREVEYGREMSEQKVIVLHRLPAPDGADQIHDARDSKLLLTLIHFILPTPYIYPPAQATPCPAQ